MSHRVMKPPKASLSDAEAAEFRDLLADAREALYVECMAPSTPVRDLPRAVRQYVQTVAEIREFDPQVFGPADIPSDSAETRAGLLRVRDHLHDLIKSGEVPAREMAALARRVSQLQAAVVDHDTMVEVRERAAERLGVNAYADVPFDPATVLGSAPFDWSKI